MASVDSQMRIGVRAIVEEMGDRVCVPGKYVLHGHVNVFDGVSCTNAPYRYRVGSTQRISTDGAADSGSCRMSWGVTDGDDRVLRDRVSGDRSVTGSSGTEPTTRPRLRAGRAVLRGLRQVNDIHAATRGPGAYTRRIGRRAVFRALRRW